MMSEIEEIERTIAALESQRGVLGDRTIDIALGPLREKLQELRGGQKTSDRQLKYVSALFTDIVGSTRMGQHLDPEDNMEIMTGALERFKDIIEQHGGRVTRFMGDGLKAMFGIPATSEDDAERAVKAGLSLIESAKEYAKQVEEVWELKGFNIRVGINTGQILLGGGVEDENTAMGMAINLAARMEGAAPVGGVLISEHTYQHVRGKFEVSALPPFQVKGVERPVQTYQVLQVSPRSFHTKWRGVPGVSTVLIGREAELTMLKDAYHSIFEIPAHPKLITILGEAGVGKSRLLEEFEDWMEQFPDKINCYKGRATPQTFASPYRLLRELITLAFNIPESDPADKTLARLESGLTRFLDNEAEMKIHFIGALLGYDYRESPHLKGLVNDPKQINQRGLFYLEECFQNVAREAPTVVLVEDIHWADEPSLNFLLQILDSLGDNPLLVVCLARRILLENYPEWPMGDYVPGADCLIIELKPLTETQSRRLIHTILSRAQEVPESLQDRIVQQAEGNPYYIEEIINMLIDDGIIHAGESPAGWKIDASRIDSLRIPPTLTAVLQTRMDGLPAFEKNVLQRAAVIGRKFWDRPVQLMSASLDPPDVELLALTDRSLIQSNATSIFQGTREYHFRQSLLRDVAYETVLKRDRIKYHAKVAAWLSEAAQTSGRLDEHLSLIGEHYDRAGDRNQAAVWYLQAGERARSQGALREARRFYDRTLNLLPESDQERRWRALLDRDEVLGLLGETSARQEDDQALLALAQAAGDERWLAEAYYRLGYSASNRGDERNALEAYKTAVSTALNCSEPELAAESLALSAISLTRLGDLHNAERAANEVLELVKRIEDDVTLAKVYTNIAAHYSEVGNLSRAIELLQEQIRTTQSIDHRVGEAIGLSNLGYAYTQLGEYTSAESALKASMNINQTIGARHHHAFGQLNLGLVYWRTGRFSMAERVLEEALQTLNGIDDQFGCAAGLIYQGLNQESCEDFSGAMNSYIEAREMLEDLGLIALGKDAAAGVARCAMVTGKADLMQDVTEDLWRYLKQKRGKGMEFPILAFLTCANIFSSHEFDQDPHAVIQMGFHELTVRADKISHSRWRRAYLENVPEHAEISTRWKLIKT